MLDGNNLAQVAGIDDLLDGAEEVGIAQYMSDCHGKAQRIGFFFDFDAFLRIRGDGFLKKNMISAIQRLHHMPIVVTVHGGNDGCVCNLTQIQQIFSVGKAPVCRDIQPCGSILQTVRAKLCYGCDFNSVIICPLTIGHTSAACTDEDIFHRERLLRFLLSIAVI